MNSLQVIERENQRVLTTAQIAEQYETTTERIKDNFNSNKARYTEGKHYYCLTGEELKEFKNLVGNSDVVDKRTPKLYLWTEKGALLHAKSLNTDKAWQAYEVLVDTYFNVREGVYCDTKILDYCNERFLKIESQISELMCNMTKLMSVTMESIQGIQKETIQEDKEYAAFTSEQNICTHTKSSSIWYRKMHSKYEMLTDFFGCSRKKLYSEIFKKLENMLGINVNRIHEEYCLKYGLSLSDTYIMDAVTENPVLRSAIEKIVDTALVENKLKSENRFSCLKSETIFD